MWSINSWYYGGGVKQLKQATRKLCAKRWMSIHYKESEGKKLTASAALTA